MSVTPIGLATWGQGSSAGTVIGNEGDRLDVTTSPPVSSFERQHSGDFGITPPTGIDGAVLVLIGKELSMPSGRDNISSARRGGTS